MSLNDPNWGRGGPRGQGPSGGNQGPPDLDELWRSFNRRLSDLFGRRGGGNGGGQIEPPSAGRIGGGASVLIGLVLAVWLASGFYIVDASQRGVVLTFGKYSEETMPGLHWRMPWPIQSQEVVNISQVRTLEVGYRNNVRTKVQRESLMLTDDENIVDLQFAVQFTVKNAKDYLFNVRRPDETAMQIAETAMREVIGKSKMDGILYESREEIAIKARKLMQEIHDRYEHRYRHELGHHPGGAAARAGAGGIRRRGEGRSGPRAPEERGPGLRQRRDPQGAWRGLAPAAGVAGLQAARGGQRRGRSFALQAGARGVLQGARGDARAHLPRDPAAGAVVDLEDHPRLQGQRQPALPAARQADAAERRGYAVRLGRVTEPGGAGAEPT